MALRARVDGTSRRPPSLLRMLETASHSGEQRDRRIARTRLALLEAAQRLFATRPIDGVSIGDIIAEAEVAKGSFYNHFDSKEALAEELFQMVRRHAASLLADALSPDVPPPERLAQGAFVILRFTVDNPESAAALIRLSPEMLADSAPLNARAREIIVEGLASGHFRGIPVDAATLLVIGVTLVMLQDSIDDRKPFNRLIAKAVPLIAGALKALGVEPESAAAAAKAAAKTTLARS